MYDRRRQVIGVMPAALDREHTYRLRHKHRSSDGRAITARNFCRHYEIRPSETLIFPKAAVNRDGVLILDLQTVQGAGRQ